MFIKTADRDASIEKLTRDPKFKNSPGVRKRLARTSAGELMWGAAGAGLGGLLGYGAARFVPGVGTKGRVMSALAGAGIGGALGYNAPRWMTDRTTGLSLRDRMRLEGYEHMPSAGGGNSGAPEFEVDANGKTRGSLGREEYHRILREAEAQTEKERKKKRRQEDIDEKTSLFGEASLWEKTKNMVLHPVDTVINNLPGAVAGGAAGFKLSKRPVDALSNYVTRKDVENALPKDPAFDLGAVQNAVDVADVRGKLNAGLESNFPSRKEMQGIDPDVLDKAVSRSERTFTDIAEKVKQSTGHYPAGVGKVKTNKKSGTSNFSIDHIYDMLNSADVSAADKDKLKQTLLSQNAGGGATIADALWSSKGFSKKDVSHINIINSQKKNKNGVAFNWDDIDITRDRNGKIKVDGLSVKDTKAIKDLRDSGLAIPKSVEATSNSYRKSTAKKITDAHISSGGRGSRRGRIARTAGSLTATAAAALLGSYVQNKVQKSYRWVAPSRSSNDDYYNARYKELVDDALSKA